MSLLTRRHDPSVPQRTIPEAKITWLGDPIRGHRYGRHRDTEYMVEMRPSDPEAFVADANERLVSFRHVEMIDGSPWPTNTYHRAFPTPTGTYAKLVGRKARKADDTTPRAWDRLATLPLMQRREPMRMATGPAASAMDRVVHMPSVSEQEQEALAGAVDMVRGNRYRKLIEVGGNTPPERSVAGLVGYLQDRGVSLELARGRLIARSVKPIRADLRELIEQAEELIVGHLRGQAVLCSQCAQAAVTVVFPSAPACAEHAQ